MNIINAREGTVFSAIRSDLEPENNPVVSIVVPARNEEASLGACLDSLVAQTGIKFEIIVVDDGSTDRTSEIARSFATTHVGAVLQGSRPPRFWTDGTKTRLFVLVMSAPPLPNGWTGKNNAMSAGAKIAKGKWLLFTDADTVHRPGSLARAVAEAEKEGAALLSYSPEQEVRTFWEKAVMPVIFAELGATYPPSKVRDPASPIAAANGQYLMISRETYDSLGGHTKIAGDLLEDVAMARLVKSSGRKIWFRYGGDAVRTRMYRSWAQMKEGWTKNLALLFEHPVRRALMLLAFWAFSWITFGLGLAAMMAGYGRGAFYVLCALFLYGRVAWGRFRRATNLVAITVGIPIADYLFLTSAARHKKRGVTWKGRTYVVGPVASDAFLEGIEDGSGVGHKGI